MNYIKLATMEYPRYQGDIRLEHPDIGDVFVCPDTYAHVQDTPEPAVTETQMTVEQFPAQNNGAWERQWAVVDKPVEST
jgi:hypothetical protein